MENNNYFKSDCDRYYLRAFGTTKPGILKKARLWIEHHGFHCVAAYRLGKYAKNLRNRNRLTGFFFRCLHNILSFFIKLTYQVDIDAARIGPGLYIGHVGTIYIGPCEIGRNLSIAHNITIGVGHEMKMSDIPVIGDNVWIGTGSIISGPIKIGNNVTISSGCVLSKDIPDGCLVGGNPGRIIMRDYDNSSLINGR